MREPAGTAAHRGFGVGFDELLDDIGRSSPQPVELLRRKRVAHGHEPVAVEQRRRSLDLAGFAHLESADAVSLHIRCRNAVTSGSS